MRGAMLRRTVVAAALGCCASLMFISVGWAQYRTFLGVPLDPGPVSDNCKTPTVLQRIAYLEFDIRDTSLHVHEFPNDAGRLAGENAELTRLKGLPDCYAWLPAGLFVGGSGGVTDAHTTLGFNTIGSPGADLFTNLPPGNSAASVSGGVVVGLNAPPCVIPPGLPFGGTPVSIGVIGQMDWMDVKSTIPGTPTLLLGTGPGSDTYQAKDKSILSAGLTITVPFFPQTFPNMSLVVQGGPAWINKSITYNCNGFCDIAGIPRFSETHDVNFMTSYAGIGIQQGINIGGLPVFLSGNFQHVFAGGKNVSFGNPAGVFVGTNVSQEINIFKASVTVPLFTERFPTAFGTPAR